MDADKKSSLDAIETTGQLIMPRSYRTHSVAMCEDEMAATREVYASMEGKNAESRMNAFDSCRERAWFVRHSVTGDVRVATKSCKLRWCPVCAKKRQWFLVQQFTPWVESVKKLKFFTLTLKHTNNPLSQQISDLYGFFQAFRKLKYLRENMHGGVWFFQIKKSTKDGLWHPHLHCLIDANYMPHAKLSALWQRTTLSSKIIDIRPADDRDKVAEYVGRYSARPSELASMSLDERLEVVTALHGRRLVGTWGTAKYKAVYEYVDADHQVLPEKPCDMTNIERRLVSSVGVSTAMAKPIDAGMWKHVGYWSTVHGCLGHDENAKAIFDAWRKDEPLEAGIDMMHIEQNFDGVHCLSGVGPPETRQLYIQWSGPLPF